MLGCKMVKYLYLNDIVGPQSKHLHPSQFPDLEILRMPLSNAMHMYE